METPEVIEQTLRTFEADREKQGWDTPASLWVVSGDNTITHLVDIPLNTEPDKVLRGLYKTTGVLDSNIHGVLTSFEGWIHPERILRQLETMEPEVAEQVFNGLRHPSSYHDRQEVRTVVFVNKVGDVAVVGRKRGADHAMFHMHDRTESHRLSDAMKSLLGCHPHQSIRRVVESCMEELSAIMRKALTAGDVSDDEETHMDELVDRILTAYKIHLPQDYDRQVALLNKITGNRYPNGKPRR